MPIMAANDQNDVRGSARVLASTAKKSIEEDLASSRYVSALNNFYRLLEAYRSHRFIGFEYEPRSARGPEALTLLPPMDRNVVDLREALDLAFKEIYGDQDWNAAVDSVENVLRSAAFPEKEASAPKYDRERASAFLKTFIDNLYLVP